MNQKLLLAHLLWTYSAFASSDVISAPTSPTSVPGGAILNQLNDQNRADLSGQVLQIPEEVVVFEGLKFVGPNQAIIDAANAYQQQDIGEKLSISDFITKLNHWMQTEKHFAITFIRQQDGTYSYLDQVIYEGADISNASGLRDGIADSVINYGVNPNQPVDVAQLERNATIQNELPGVVGQYGMVPGNANGTTRLRDQVGNGSRFTGHLGTNNEGMRAVGEIAGTGSLHMNNLLGFSDHFAVNGQASEHAGYISLSGDVLVHASGTRLSINGSTYQYGYDVLTDANHGLTSNRSRMTGTSNAYWSELTQPLLRNSENKINGILGYAYKTNTANANVNAVTAPYIDGLGQQQPGGSASQFFQQNDNGIHDVYLELNGTSGTRFGKVAYDFKFTYGEARQHLGSVYSADQFGADTYGGSFQKFNLQGQFSSLPISRLWDSSLTAATSMQFSDRNLVTAEQQYVGGAYQMRAWSPQLIGGAQVLWGELGIEKWLTSSLSIKPFIEAAGVRTNMTNYAEIINGVSVNSKNGNSNFMADVGLSLSYNPPVSGLTITGTVAGKLTANPSQFGMLVTDDSSVRGWLKAQWFF